MNYKEFLIKFQKKEIVVHQDIAEREPMVSVCVQTYQHVNYIKECLDGILMQQTTFPFEILLGEDGSTDGTREICLEYAQKHPDKIRLFLHHRENNIAICGNPTGRFNFIYNLYNTRGKYIALCEGDDYWTDPLKLQKQVGFLEGNQDVAICFHRANLLKGKELSLHPIPESFEQNSFNYIELLKHYNFITTASVMCRNVQPLQFPKWYYNIPFGDLGLYKIISDKKMIQCIGEIMNVYRLHDHGVYSGITKFKANQNYLRFYQSICPVLDKEEQKVVKFKMIHLINTISEQKYSRNPLLKKGYNMYLRKKYL